MATKTIDQLPSSSPLTGTEVLPIVQGNETLKTTVQNVADLGGNYLVTSDSNIDWSLASTQEVNITQDTELTFSGAKEGQKLTLILNASQSFDIGFPDSVIWNRSNVFDYDIEFLVDENFKPDVSSDLSLDSFLLQSNDKILITTSVYDEIEEIDIFTLSRLNSNGTVDNTFNEYIFEVEDGDFSLEGIQSNDKILITTSVYDEIEEIDIFTLSRLNSNGTVDNTFNEYIVEDGGFSLEGIQSNDKILITTRMYDNVDEIRYDILSRLNSNGTVDNTFNEYSTYISSPLSNNYIENIYIQSDGKILIVISNYDDNTGEYTYTLSRLNSDGTVDNTFNDLILQPEEYIATIVETNNNEIIIGGEFELMNQDNLPTYGIFMLNNDGTPGNNPANALKTDGNPSQVDSILKDSNGKLIVVGAFNQYGPFATPISQGIIRLNDDLSIDETFNAGSGFSSFPPPFSSPLLNSNDNIIGFNNNMYQSFNGEPLLNESLNKIIESKGYRIINFYYNGDNYIGTFS